MRREQQPLGGGLRQHRLGHAVVKPRQDTLEFRFPKRPVELKTIGAAPFETLHRQAAVAGDVGRLGRPGRDRSEARHDHDLGVPRPELRGRPIGQQRIEHAALGVVQGPLGVNEVQEVTADVADGV